MLRLRPYNKNDAETIMSWIKDEKSFYKWTAGVLGEYPISVEQFNTVSNLMAFTAIDDNEIAGFFTMRKPSTVWFCNCQSGKTRTGIWEKYAEIRPKICQRNICRRQGFIRSF